MSLRFRLLLLSLLTLALPWAGCEYARQMESVQRKSQEDALLTTAKVLAGVIATDNELIEQSFPQASGAAAESAPRLFAAQLLAHPLLDGFADEWPQPSRPLPSSIDAKDDLRLGLYGGALYAFLRVRDGHVVYENPNEVQDDGSSQTHKSVDRIVLISRDVTGIDRAWSISAVAPGPVIARSANAVAPWSQQDTQDDEIRGAWRATNDGYDVELRIPQRFLGAAFAMVALDESAVLPETITLHPLYMASAALRSQLQLYAPQGVRLSIVDTQGWLLARAGTLLVGSQAAAENDERINFYRWLLNTNEQTAPAYGLPYGMWGEPVDTARQGKSSAIWFQAGSGEPSTVRAAVPIVAGQRILGVLAVEQAAEQLLISHDAAFASLFKWALLATFFAVIFAIVFAAWLSRRIRRLSIAASTALSPEGRIEQRLPETTANDELGDLARSFASLLHRINDYAGYLQTLGAKLSHEFRTPLAIVSSSLENLAAEKAAAQPQIQQFIERARVGTLRLQTILSAMTEATRVEQSIEQAERVKFDLADLVRSAGTAYGQTFATHRIQVLVPERACPMNGAPELIMQMLDKLIDNAIDFCPPQGRITLELSVASKHYRLVVINEGPALPADIADKVFDLLVSNRTASADKPHLGLGLYIVQLIARFHGGRAAASNLANGTGVKFEIELPLP